MPAAEADIEGDIVAEAEQRGFGTSDADLAAYAETAGAAGGVAACSAVGAAPAAPLCGYVGGKVGAYLGDKLASMTDPDKAARERKRRQLAQSRAYDKALRDLNAALETEWYGAVRRVEQLRRELGVEPSSAVAASWQLAEWLPSMGWERSSPRVLAGDVRTAAWPGARQGWAELAAPLPDRVFSEAFAPMASGANAATIVQGQWGPAIGRGVTQLEAWLRKLQEAEVRATARAMAKATLRESVASAGELSGKPASAWPSYSPSSLELKAKRARKRKVTIAVLGTAAGLGMLGAGVLLWRKGR